MGVGSCITNFQTIEMYFIFYDTMECWCNFILQFARAYLESTIPYLPGEKMGIKVEAASGAHLFT